jgi:hypothetical protein
LRGTKPEDDGAVRAAVALLTLSFFAPVATGCISNEYVIPRQELHRLTTVPPEVRGQQVHVIQDLGSRRADALATDGPNWPNAEPWPQPYPGQQEPPPEPRDTDAELHLHGSWNVYVGPGGRPYPPPPSQGWTGAPRTAGMTPAGGGWQGKPPSGGGLDGAWRGTPTGGAGGGWRGVPPGAKKGGSSGGGSGLGSWGSGSSSGGGGGGGGNGGGEALIILAVVVAVIAVVTTVCLVSSEGMRFDGLAQMSPWQPVHLKQRGGGELVVALGDLSPVTLEGVVEGKVMDDEGYGIRQLDHRRLDRRWAPTFKVDAGSMTFTRGDGDVRSGFVGNMQLGLFVRPWLGLLLTAGVGGADDRYGATISRHVFGFETQSLPLAAGPFQFGGYANIGAAAIASTATNHPVAWGNAVGGGLLGELQVTSRMALTLRAGANAAFFANSGATSPAATITAGLALY